MRMTMVGDAGFDDGLDELILRAEEVERVAIAEMIFRPGFTVGGFGFADDPRWRHRPVLRYRRRF